MRSCKTQCITCTSECACVCVCVYERKRGRAGVEKAGSVMLPLWQIDVKSSGASPPLHRINNDERPANEGLCVDAGV